MTREINLPLLLNPVRVLNDYTDEYEEFWDADDVKAYATAAVLADRDAQQERNPHTEVEVPYTMQWTKSGLRVDLAGLAQQERKPHTEAEVKDLMFWRDKTSIRSFEALVRRILGVPAPKETP